MMWYDNPNSIRANQEARVRLGRSERQSFMRLIRKNKHA